MNKNPLSRSLRRTLPHNNHNEAKRDGCTDVRQLQILRLNSLCVSSLGLGNSLPYPYLIDQSIGALEAPDSPFTGCICRPRSAGARGAWLESENQARK